MRTVLSRVLLAPADNTGAMPAACWLMDNIADMVEAIAREQGKDLSVKYELQLATA